MRAVIFPASLVEIAKLVGAGGRVVGVNEEIGLDYCLPDFRDRPVVGKYLQREKLTYWDVLEELKPDVIMDFEIDTLYSIDELKAFAERHNAKLALFDIVKVEDLFQITQKIASLLGGDPSALLEFYRRHLERIGEIASGVEERRKVVMLYRGINVVTQTNVLSDAVEKTGAEYMAKLPTHRKVVPVPFEEFVKRFSEADVFILLTSVLTNEEKLREIRDEMLDSSEWRKVKAVDAGEVHILGSAIDRKGFMRWSPRIIPGIYQLGRVIYPDHYPEWGSIAKELYRLCGVEK
ncbi:ABC transporter substrate-binding protein [Thermococcus sp. Bubb.Bath]|uniref:ABC transporter substrate-binding protein n=1 Tax=Thermococcus sp. Bubb.Bath TaxID=1638242 RepID=UPI001438CEF9|nr:ABC transporter substrate-binding protein [Thermococcus sp. Bubb.Bath]NJF24202.1 ABC transporter substrate-binding protein [Thermococcus sp. Bubb.Bath]